MEPCENMTENLDRLLRNQHRTIVYNRHVKDDQPKVWRGLRSNEAVSTHALKCGCRAAHANMAHEIIVLPGRATVDDAATSSHG